MKIYIHSCHAVLEYDQAQMFAELGHAVTGMFDVGSKQRPKIEGVTDVIVTGKSDTQRAPTDIAAASKADAVVVHQMDRFPDRVAEYAELGVPTVLVAFGQGTMEQHDQTVDIMERYPNVYVVAYSRKDYGSYKLLGAPDPRLKMIRFAKKLDEFGPWQPIAGDDPVCLVVGNDMHRRGDACGWPVAEELLRLGVPIQAVGNHTDDLVFGLGEVPFSRLKRAYCEATVALSLGTTPAPYTLSLIEECASGTPTIAWDNGHGIADEQLGVHVVQSIAEAEAAIKKALLDPVNAEGLGKRSRLVAESCFHWADASAKWRELFSQIAATKGKR